MVTVSPSCHFNVGAGIDPFIVVATRVLPVKFTNDSETVRSNSVPESSGASLEELNERLVNLMCCQAIRHLLPIPE